MNKKGNQMFADGWAPTSNFKIMQVLASETILGYSYFTFNKIK